MLKCSAGAGLRAAAVHRADQYVQAAGVDASVKDEQSLHSSYRGLKDILEFSRWKRRQDHWGMGNWIFEDTRM